MRSFLAAGLCLGLVAVLIPYPGLLPVSLIGLAAMWFATPMTSKPRRRAAKPREERGS